MWHIETSVFSFIYIMYISDKAELGRGLVLLSAEVLVIEIVSPHSSPSRANNQM